LIIKEAINNVAKYSMATKLVIDIELINNDIKIQIIGNGIGFDVNTAKGNGIGNMQKKWKN
jgi:signal transduction histidine kinase